MLKGYFFEIKQISETQMESGQGDQPEHFQVKISLNPGHPIYQGHFPGNPVVPGVCQIRMITEIISEIFQKEVRLLEADNIKFLSMINPHEHPELTVDCRLQNTEEGNIRITASISDREKIFFKSKSIFT